MRKKDYSLLIAAFIGLSSGWAVLNQDVLAAEEEFDQESQEIQAEPQTDEEDTGSENGTNNVNSLPDPEGTENGSDISSDPGKDQKDQLDDEDPDESEEPEESGKETSLSVNEQPSKPLGTAEKVEGPEESLAETVSVNTVPKKTAVAAAPAKVANVLNGWNGNKYYENNVMAVGEKKIGNELHLFDNDGNPLSGFMYYNGKYLYCDAQGKILKGSHTIGNYSFTADESGNIYSSTLNNVPYYNQKDGRWGNQYIGGYTVGSTGCVVMAATSIVNYFTGSNYSPLDLANLLHSEGYYNSSMEGTKSSVWKFIANKFGLTYQNNLSKQDAEKALKEGKIVTGAVGYSQWCPYIGYTHEIFMTGYNNGTTYIFDPLHSDKCGNASISSVFAVLSTEIEDLRDNGPLFAIGKNTISVINTGLADKGTIVIGDQAYTGNPVTTKPIVGIYQNGSYIQLTEGKGYTVSFANNTKAGEATVTVTGKGLYKGTISKKFYIVNPTLVNSNYNISTSGANGLVLDILSSAKYTGGKLQLYTSNNTSAQQFVIEKQANGYYTIRNKNSGLYLATVSDWRKLNNGLQITQQNYKDDKSSWWMLRSTANGYIISSAWDTQYVMDVQNGAYKNGSKIQLFQSNGTKAQLWKLTDLNAKKNEMDRLAAQNAKTLSDGYYTIATMMNTGKMLDVFNASKTNGANIQIYSSNGTDAQLFQVSHSGNYVKIMNVSSGKVLDVAGGVAKPNTNVQQFQWNGSESQLWIAVSTNTGIKLISALDKNLVLDLNNGYTSNGTNVKVYTSNDSKAQRWKFNKVEDPKTVLDRLAAQNVKTLSDGYYTIATMMNTGKTLDVFNASKTNGANIQIYSNNGTDAQLFQVSHSGNYVKIMNVASGKVLDVAGGVAKPNTNVQQYQWGGGRNQLWIAVSTNTGIKLISALDKNLVLDLNNGYTSNGTNVKVYTSNDSKAQRWKFNKVEDPKAALDRLAKQSIKYVAEGEYEIHSMINEQYNLDVTNADKKTGANVQLYIDNNTDAQRWRVSFDEKGYAMLQSINSGKFLSLNGSKIQSGENIVQSDLVNENQKWIFTSLNGAVQIVSALNKDYVVDLSGAHSVNGRNIQLYANNRTKAQQWRFVNTKFSNSSLAYKWVPASKENYTVGREGCEITNITIHHMDGKATAESCGAVFQNPNHAASAHYGIGYNGEICQYVDEKDTAWANANWESNKHSVTIENSDWTLAPNYVISDATINSLIRLVADIAARNNIGKLVYGHNINVHGDIAATSCPGPYLREKLPDIILSSNKLNGFN
ncbi:RICIN domain-containing protein [uncultured Dubosiella sp.]|uniref:RICIN domain-containing protein n=2 Tax=uncultured Dubosiella sp. TaxID=1937011 RepID=UPI0025D0190C|nr:RICIN domain-containing protein [uncultured Dubosiella sp.]